MNVSASTSPIPNTLHFVWFGESLPYFAVLAIRSALRANPGASATLWHGEELMRDDGLDALERDGTTLRPIRIDELLVQAHAQVAHDANLRVALSKLRAVYGELTAPAARSNLIRLLVLFAQGGVYLDTDTLSLQSLAELRALDAFCGREHVLWPKRRLDKLSAYYWTTGPALEALRALGSWLPNGHVLYRRTRRWYETAVNNAVLGFAPGHPLLARAFRRVAELEGGERTRRYRLGTHLLQEVVSSRPEGEPMTITLLDPDCFYPLGPIISAHYFKRRRDAARVAALLLPPRTRVVHWYSSVSNLSPLDEKYIREHRTESVYAHLCARFVD
jgi:hypothetical protein